MAFKLQNLKFETQKISTRLSDFSTKLWQLLKAIYYLNLSNSSDRNSSKTTLFRHFSVIIYVTLLAKICRIIARNSFKAELKIVGELPDGELIKLCSKWQLLGGQPWNLKRAGRDFLSIFLLVSVMVWCQKSDEKVVKFRPRVLKSHKTDLSSKTL